MSRYKSIHTAYNPLKKKNVPIWRLDTNTVTVTHFNADTLNEDHKTYHTDYIRYHLHYSDSKYPDRLRRLVNEGKIIEYLDDLELKVGEAIDRQVERWKKSDADYQSAILSGNAEKMLGLENCFIGMARTANIPTGFADSSTRVRLLNILMISNRKSVQRLIVRLSVGRSLMQNISLLSSAAMLRRCSG